MSDATYSKIELRDLDSAAAGELEPPQQAVRAASASPVSSLSSFEKPSRIRSWQNDLRRESLVKNARNAKDATARNVRDATANAVPLIRAATLKTVPLVKAGIRTRSFRRHAVAFFTLFIFGLLPLIVYFKVLQHPFVASPVTCGKDNTVKEQAPGAAGLFTIDRVAGKYPFWLAKFLDTLWDLFVARGMQFLAGCVSYIVFSNALLRAIEESPIPYRTFIGVTLNGPSAWTVVCMLLDLGRYSRKRSVWLFAYGALALSYVLAMPTLLSTMTGYISSSSPFTKVPGTEQFVPADSFKSGYTFFGLPDVPDDTCVLYNVVQPAMSRDYSRSKYCNTTCAIHLNHGNEVIWRETGVTYWTTSSELGDILEREKDDNCSHFSNETYEASGSRYDEYGYYVGGSSDDTTYNCNDTVFLTIAGHNYTVDVAMNSTRPSYNECYNGTGYPNADILANGRCLPDADGGGASYQWGFSAMLTSVVLIVHACWALSMYAIWLDAELGSSLLRAGYHLTQLRGAFAVAAAAEETTGWAPRELRSVPADEVEARLYERGAAVRFELFRDELPFANVEPFEEA
ncbi:uncharacterized protein LTHEOB_12960 [Neofusicoccum parvum]|nr:uncharacterized protein LTHEOB_12960 [Neofusicoccum parvum]